MLSRTLINSVPSRSRLTFNIKNIDDLFPGFALGNFAVFHGSTTALPLSMLLCVRAQLPYQLGGLETNVVFVDCGNTFRLYHVSRIAQRHKLDPREVLERIFISRAFTAYQVTSLILDELQNATQKFDSKLVMISDIAGLYLDKDVPKKEARGVFNQLTVHLSNFARENHVIVLATYLPHHPSKRNLFFKATVCGRANVVVSATQSKHGQQFALEKHPFLSLGKINFPSEKSTLTNFLEA